MLRLIGVVIGVVVTLAGLLYAWLKHREETRTRYGPPLCPVHNKVMVATYVGGTLYWYCPDCAGERVKQYGEFRREFLESY